jgi:hypothetical protein
MATPTGIAEGSVLGAQLAGKDFWLDPLKGVDANGVWAWIDNYCGAHPLNPLETVEKAAAEFALFAISRPPH